MLSLIIDSRAGYLSGKRDVSSLLTLPVGMRSVLEYLTQRVSGIANSACLVMPTFEYDTEYEEALQRGCSQKVGVTGPQKLALALRDHDPSDYLVVIDPARWPVNGFDFSRAIRDYGQYRAASHLVSIGANADRAREHVECDALGNVKRVRRLFDRASWPEVATTEIFLSVIPVWSVNEVTFSSLPELRAALSAQGVLSRDLPEAVDLVDLTVERGLLALNERLLQRCTNKPAGNGFRRLDHQVLVGTNCTIQRGARIVGPVVIHDGAVIEEDASIVGPSVLGAGCRVRRRATVAGAVVAPGVVIEPQETVLHCIAFGTKASRSHESGFQAPLVSEALRISGSKHYTDGDLRAAVRSSDRRRRVHLAIKRGVDIILSLIALVLLLPFLIVVAVLIKLDSRGPVLFSHSRERRGGKDFPCLKFRTMVIDADRIQRELTADNEVDGPQFKMDDDPRVTRLGRWLRSSNIDEIPQLINVLWGHMSLVGPRPSPFRENQICIPWRRARLSVSPGITGLWQICRDERSGGDFHQWIYYDLAYVRNLSIWLDLKILIATLVTLGGKWNVPYIWFIPAYNMTESPEADMIRVENAAFA
ncbi:MAG: sugar transferase [Planctomycetes bacterium]|nr:sugar transferase [Planctomycetota bacterium]